MPAATTLSTLFHGTSLPCPVDKAGLCNKHGKLVQPRNCDFPCQSIQNLDTSSVDLAASSTKSCTKFCRYIQHPSLSEEKDKPVEPERLKLKIERYRSLEWNVLFFLSDVFIFFVNVLVFSEKNKDFRNDTEQWPETGFYTYVSKWTSIYIRQILHFGKKGCTSFIKFLMPLYSSIFQQFLSLFTT